MEVYISENLGIRKELNFRASSISLTGYMHRGDFNNTVRRINFVD